MNRVDERTHEQGGGGERTHEQIFAKVLDYKHTYRFELFIVDFDPNAEIWPYYANFGHFYPKNSIKLPYLGI